MRLWPKEDASESLRRYGDEGAKPFNGIGILQNHIDEYVPNCMTAHGYVQNVQPDACDPAFQFHMQAACYETSTQYWFDKQWSRFKNALAEHSNAR